MAAIKISPPEQSSVRSLRLSLAVAVCLLVLPLVLRATTPGWWSNGVLTPNVQANDYAAVNQGQAKNLAFQAMQELDAHLPGGGAGELVHTKFDEWSVPTATANDYSPVKLGALKELARPFYARLIEVGYVDDYPWAGKQSLANDSAAANIGQAKNLFSFDVTHDTDGDGLPDWWEKHWYGLGGVDSTQLVAWGVCTVLQAYQQGLNPLDFYNGHTPALGIVDGNNQEGFPGNFVFKPLTVSVTDTVGNRTFAGAPVTFTVASNQGQVQQSSNSAPVTSLTVLANFEGQAKVYFRLPPGAPATCQIIAVAKTGTAGSKTFTEQSVSDPGGGGGEPGPGPGPFDPSNVVATMNLDGSADVTWTNHAGPSDTELIDIMYRDKDGHWAKLIDVPAGTTSCHIPAP